MVAVHFVTARAKLIYRALTGQHLYAIGCILNMHTLYPYYLGLLLQRLH